MGNAKNTALCFNTAECTLWKKQHVFMWWVLSNSRYRSVLQLNIILWKPTVGYTDFPLQTHHGKSSFFSCVLLQKHLTLVDYTHPLILQLMCTAHCGGVLTCWLDFSHWGLLGQWHTSLVLDPITHHMPSPSTPPPHSPSPSLTLDCPLPRILDVIKVCQYLKPQIPH